MKFLHKLSDLIIKRGILGSSIVRVSRYSSERRPNLYDKLVKCHRERISVLPVLDEWVAQVGNIREQTLRLFIKNFKARCRFIPALEIVEWMSRSRNRYPITPEIVAVHLELLFRAHGIEKAEHYFNRLEDNLVDFPVYVALLNCYAEVKYETQAEATMNCIRRFNSGATPPYNIMLRLYSGKRKHEKLDALIQEMQDKGIVYNKVTYSILLKTYERTDVKRMEKLLAKMESDGRFAVDFHSYAAAANGYLKAGVLDKAFELSKKAESVIGSNGKSSAYPSVHLMTYYAAMQKKDDVYRIWNQLNVAELSNKAYVSMLSSLAKLDDLDGARKILEEWEGRSMAFNIEIPNIVIRSYCRKGDVGDAEIILKRLVDNGMELDAVTFGHMALGYLKNGQMDKAVEMERKAFLASLPGWKPNFAVVEACLEYLQNKGDADGVQEMLMMMEKYGSSSVVKEMVGRFSSNGKPKTENGNETATIKDFYVPLFISTAGRK